MNNSSTEFIKRCITEITDIILKFLDQNKYGGFDRLSISFGITKNDILKLAGDIVNGYFIYDVERLTASDPAINVADDSREYALHYKGMQAIMYYRIAHRLYIDYSICNNDECDFDADDFPNDNDEFDFDLNNFPKTEEVKKEFFIYLARDLSEEAAKLTTIEIHPGAQIDRGFVIDHGVNVCISKEDTYLSDNEDTSTVIGETCIIGKNCCILNGVILGASTVNRGMVSDRRHPKIGDNVTICAGVRILGSVIIGDNVFISPRCVIITDIPSNTRVSIVNQLQIESVKKNDTKNNQLDSIKNSNDKINIYGLVPHGKILALYGDFMKDANLEVVDDCYNTVEEINLTVHERKENKVMFCISAEGQLKVKNLSLKISVNDKIIYLLNSKTLYSVLVA